MLTDEARDAFTCEKMPAGWPRENGATRNFKAWAPECRKAWLYDARNALERLGYVFNQQKDGRTHWCGPQVWFYHNVPGSAENPDAAIEAGVQYWWEEQQ